MLRLSLNGIVRHGCKVTFETGLMRYLYSFYTGACYRYCRKWAMRMSLKWNFLKETKDLELP